MNSTPAEFRRALRQAFGAAVCECADGLLLEVDNVCLHFALTSQMPRKIGALELAVLHVQINVRDGAAAAVDKLLARVDRATQRGGG